MVGLLRAIRPGTTVAFWTQRGTRDVRHPATDLERSMPATARARANHTACRAQVARGEVEPTAPRMYGEKKPSIPGDGQ
jgi:hypothetical protein